MKICSFYTSRGTSSLPSMNKIRDGRVFSLVHLTWNDPYATRLATAMGQLLFELLFIFGEYCLAFN